MLSFFKKNLSGTLSGCQTVRIQIRTRATESTNILSVLIWVQTVCKGYQQITKVTASKEQLNKLCLQGIRKLPCSIIEMFVKHCATSICLSIMVFLFLIVCLFDLILYVPSTIFQLNRDGSSWVEPVLS